MYYKIRTITFTSLLTIKNNNSSMDQKILYAMVGIAILATSTLGFGASLSTTPAPDRIGASDNISVAAARGNITSIVWTEEVAADGVIEVDTITFTVGNEDTAAHAFQVCAVLEGPASTYSPAAGSAPECVAVSSIAQDAVTTSQSITFSTAVDASDIVDISFTIEETS